MATLLNWYRRVPSTDDLNLLILWIGIFVSTLIGAVVVRHRKFEVIGVDLDYSTPRVAPQIQAGKLKECPLSSLHIYRATA